MSPRAAEWSTSNISFSAHLSRPRSSALNWSFRKHGIDKSMAAIQSIGDGELASHGAFFVRSFSFVTAQRVMENSAATIGSMLRANVNCSRATHLAAIRTPVVITAPKVRTSKKFWHIQSVASSCAFVFILSASSFALGSIPFGLIGLRRVARSARPFAHVDVEAVARLPESRIQSCASCASGRHR